MQSPCIKVCVYDPTRGFCSGCYRSLDEIAGWGSADEARQQAILDACEQRRLRHEGGGGV